MLRLPQKLVLLLDLLIQTGQLLIHLLQCRLILLQKLLEKLQASPHPSFKLHLAQAFQLQADLRTALTDPPRQILADAPAGLVIFLPPFLRRVPQPVLHLLVQPGMKDLPEDLPPFLGSRQQKLLKIPLGDHGDLGKLPVIQPDHLLHRPGHLPHPCHRLPAVKKGQLRVRFLHRVPGPPPLRPEILRIPPDPIPFFPIDKFQLHEGRLLLPGIFASKHPRLPHISAGLPIQRKRDRVKYRGLSRSRISCNQKKPPVPQPGKINLRFPGIRSESTDRQLLWSHNLSSFP